VEKGLCLLCMYIIGVGELRHLKHFFLFVSTQEAMYLLKTHIYYF
jgi:hypothetical protein